MKRHLSRALTLGVAVSCLSGFMLVASLGTHFVPSLMGRDSSGQANEGDILVGRQGAPAADTAARCGFQTLLDYTGGLSFMPDADRVVSADKMASLEADVVDRYKGAHATDYLSTVLVGNAIPDVVGKRIVLVRVVGRTQPGIVDGVAKQVADECTIAAFSPDGEWLFTFGLGGPRHGPFTTD